MEYVFKILYNATLYSTQYVADKSKYRVAENFCSKTFVGAKKRSHFIEV